MPSLKRSKSRRWASFRFDLGLALALTALVQVQMWAGGGEKELGPGGVGSAFALLQTIPLIWRRRNPVIVFLVTFLAASVPPLMGGVGDNGFGVFGGLVGFYTVAAYRSLRFSVPSLFLAGIAATTLHQLPGMEGFDPAYLLVPWIPLVFAWFLGVQVRLRRKYAAALGEREADLEQQKRTHSMQAITEERSRIARELHDVVGHSLSIIAVQSGAARMNFDSRPVQAREVLSSIEETANLAKEEMGRLLSVMGAPDEPQEGRGLDDVDALVERVRRAGVDVILRREGDPLELSPGLDLSAYRILQEALTNIIKHGAGDRAEVVVRFDVRDLELEVTNESSARVSSVTASSSGGQGLIGMRERVSLFSGVFSAAPTEEGGFSVKARLPVDTA